MDDKKFSFIIAVTNDQYYEECVYYIQRLLVPCGYTIDILSIYEAESMCSAYNQAMNSSEAKYKIYLHQDVFIRNEKFLVDILNIFQNDESIGMIGMIGGNNMPKTGVAYRAWNVGKVDCREPDMAYCMLGSRRMKSEDTIVEAVDGLLIATQYDVLWREDLFKHFDFYDVSQSFEMRKAGYKVIVPFQNSPWVIHDSGFAKLEFYDKERQKCLNEYPDYFYADNGFDFIYDKQWNELSCMLAERLKLLMVDGNWNEISTVIDSYRTVGRKSSDLEIIGILYDVYKHECLENGRDTFFEGCTDFQFIYQKYTKARFLLRRIELGMEEICYRELKDAIIEKTISCEALIDITAHSALDKAFVMKKLIQIYCNAGLEKEAQKCRRVYNIVRFNTLPVAYSSVDLNI